MDAFKKFTPGVKRSSLKNSWEKLLQDTDAVALHSLTDEKAERFESLEGLFTERAPKSFDEFSARLREHCDAEFIRKVELITRGQAESLEWKQQRRGRLTASNIGAALKSRPDSKYIVKQVANPTPFQNIHTEYGIENEPVARELYIKTELSLHKRGKFSASGLWICAKYPWLAASPDGLITCKCCGEGLAEIKCPSSEKYRHKTAKEIAATEDYHLSMQDELPQLKKNFKLVSSNPSTTFHLPETLL